MAIMPIEIVVVGNLPIKEIEKTIDIANSLQDEFRFEFLESKDDFSKLAEFNIIRARDFLNYLNDFRDSMKLRRRTPLQADGVSKAPPHESGTR